MADKTKGILTGDYGSDIQALNDVMSRLTATLRLKVAIYATTFCPLRIGERYTVTDMDGVLHEGCEFRYVCGYKDGDDMLTGLIARLCTLKMKAIRLLNEYTMAHKDIQYYSDGSRYNYIRFIYNDVTYTGHVISAHWESDAEYIREGEFGFGRMIYTVATDDGYADFGARYMKPQAYWPGT